MPAFTIASASLHRLRRRMQAADPQTTAILLQEAGFATGEALAARWREQLRLRAHLEDPAFLDREWFSPLLAEACSGMGWGTLAAEPLGESALMLVSSDWNEADAGSSSHPACHFSCGVFAAFLTAQAGAPMAVLEVECRSRGDTHCRFLGGSSETLAAVYDLLNAGRPWREAIQQENRE